MEPAASHMGEISSSKTNQNVNKSILDVFSDLVAKAPAKRNETCITLVQHLAKSSTEDSGDNIPKDLSYTLKRLVRGLGATKQLIQKGYFTALVSILDAFPSITPDIFIDNVDKELGCSKNASKSEEGEAMMGQVLAYGAAIRGGLFASSSEDHQKHIVTTLINCGRKKSYLPFASSSFMLYLINNANESALTQVIWPVLKEEVSKPWEDQTLDSLLFLLSVHNRVPNIVKNKTIQKWLGFPLLSPQAIQHFAQKLVAGSNSITVKHPVYDEFCRTLCMPNNETLLESFWTANVDSLLAVPNKNKDHAVLHILSILLKCVTNKQQLDILVTPRVLDVIGRILSGSPSEKLRLKELHSKAREVITALGNSLSAEDVTDKVRLSVLRKILFNSGNLQYEKKTGTHIAILIENKLSAKGVQKLAKQFREVVDGTSRSADQAWINSDRKFAAQQLTRLVGHQACSNEIDWKVEQLLFLLHRGIFRQDSPNTIGNELAASLKQCFFRALDQKFPNLDTMIDVLSKIVCHVNELFTDQQTLNKTLRIRLSEQASASWHKMMKAVSQLAKKSVSNGSGGSAEQVFHVLFLFMGLQLISDPTMAEGALQELHSCHERVKGTKSAKKHSEEPQWVEVTVDLFLSLLSHDSHLLRTIVNTVFPHLSKHLTVSSFCQLLEVLDPSQNENPLTFDGDSDSGTSSDEDENSKLAISKQSNGKLKQLNGQDSIEDSSDEDSNEQSDSEEEEEEEEGMDDSDEEEDVEDDDDDINEDFEEDETINDKLRQEVRLALGNAATLTDTESVDLDEIDEEEGNRMDMALAQAFKTLRQSRSNKKSKKQLKSDEALTHFRIRVLDLVELYFSRDPSMDLCLESITPLLSLLVFCMKDTHQKPLEMRIRNVIKKLTGLKKFSSVEGVSGESLADQIKGLAMKGVRSATTFLGMSDVISECCTFLVRCSEYIHTHSSIKQKSSKSNPVASVYEMLMLDFFTKRDTLLPIGMFKAVLQFPWSGCWCLAPLIVEQAFDHKVRHFRRGQALDLLLLFFRNNHLLNSADEKQKQSLKKIVTSIIQHAIELLNGNDNTTTQTRQENRFMTEVIRLLLQILSRSETKPVDSSALSTALVDFCKQCPGVPADTKKVLTSLSKQLGCVISSLSKLKNPKRSENVEVMESNNEGKHQLLSSKKNKNRNESFVNGSADVDCDAQGKKQNVSKGKSKKAKKLERMALMGKGLDSVTFSNVSDTILNGMEPDDESMEEDSSNDSSNFNGHLLSKEKFPSKRKSKHSQSDDSQKIKKKKKVL